VLEEYAKILCVNGQAFEAVRAVATQLDLAVLSPKAGESSISLIQFRLAQIFFTKGGYDKVQLLLQQVLNHNALGLPSQWWGHLQFRLALLWTNATSQHHMAESILAKVCRELQLRLGMDAGEDDPCTGVAAVRGWLPPPPSIRDMLFERGSAFWTTPLLGESIEKMRQHYVQLLEKEVLEGKVNDRRQLRQGWHNDPVASFFHYAFAEILRSSLGMDLVPTYVYSVVYLGGGQLFPHLDRPDNELSLSTSLGTDPPGYVWPLQMDKEEYRLMPGDAVLYRGAEVMHSRSPLPNGYRSIQVIFAFRHECAECCHLV